jgi:hypothetical protein
VAGAACSPWDERAALDKNLQHNTKMMPALHTDAEQWKNLLQLTTDLVTVDLLSFFNANPYACVTPADLALCIGRQESQLPLYLNRLVDAQILEAVPVLDLVVYQLVSHEEIRRLVQHFVIWFGESFFWGRGTLTPPPSP